MRQAVGLQDLWSCENSFSSNEGLWPKIMITKLLEGQKKTVRQIFFIWYVDCGVPKRSYYGAPSLKLFPYAPSECCTGARCKFLIGFGGICLLSFLFLWLHYYHAKGQIFIFWSSKIAHKCIRYTLCALFFKKKLTISSELCSKKDSRSLI